MAVIKILAPSVRDQIAAGEVVERPVSVVKELVENSLDAGARRIQITIRDGGKSGITVSDDGFGMDAEDLQLAIERHATSKLQQLNDLIHSPALGFRGEALAAIAAVSRMTITSRSPKAATASRLQTVAGGGHRPESVAGPVGTTVEVEDLFYSVPARLKHLKSDGAELGRVQQLIVALALAYPGVAFRLATDERLLVDVPGSGDLKPVILAAYGREAAEAGLTLDFLSVDGTIRLGGFVAPVHLARSSRSAETLVVNGRIISNWTLRAALEEAYRPELGDRRYPIACITIEIPGDRVDPNVHPQKLEVRIDGERQIAALLHRAVKECLAQQSESGPYWPTAPAPMQPAVAQETMWPTSGGPAPVGTPRSAPPAASAGELGTGLNLEIRSLHLIGQWQQKYIVAEGLLGLYLVDQHAAHERVYYEQFRRQFRRTERSQMLVVPESVTLSELGAEALERQRASLEAIGFDWSQVGRGAIVLRAVPATLSNLGLDGLSWATVLEGFGREDGDHPWSQAVDQAAQMAACKTAIKAYRHLEPVEVSNLLGQLAECQDPRSCPHGRPTVLHLTMEEVDRRFGRKG